MTTITNLITNPTAGTNTNGWLTLANRTLTQVTSLPAPLPDGLAATVTTGIRATASMDHATTPTVAAYGITLTAAAHVLGLYLYIPSTWTGGTVGVGINGFAETPNLEGNADMSITDAWQRVGPPSFTIGPGGLTGSIRVRVSSGGWTSGQSLYFAAALLHAGTALVDYFDGDSPNAAWTGTPHASTSVLTIPEEPIYSDPIVVTASDPLTAITAGDPLVPIG